jgi:hypothetical protein
LHHLYNPLSKDHSKNILEVAKKSLFSTSPGYYVTSAYKESRRTIWLRSEISISWQKALHLFLRREKKLRPVADARAFACRTEKLRAMHAEQ